VRIASGQADQGTITGTVQDASGAAIGNAGVTLTNDDTGLVLKRHSNGSGVFFFSPIKIGNYRVTASSRLRNHHADWPDDQHAAAA